ncbi:MAG: hypothetical protein IPO55_00020 [Alphaproteobacteria bacterium]|nr:hypothetical protein [Alphaproteobacteria bacterium]
MVQSGSTHGITDIVESRLVQDLKSRASVAAQKLQSLRAELGSNHPEVIAARQEVSQINGDIAREVANIRKSIENELTTVTKQKSLLEANLVKLQKQADELQGKLITLQALQMEEQSSSKLPTISSPGPRKSNPRSTSPARTSRSSRWRISLGTP